MAKNPASRQARKSLDRDTGKQILLVIGLLMELGMMAAGLGPAVWLVMHYAPRAGNAVHWTLIILGAVLVFNFGYLIGLLIFRIIIPYPDEGLHTMAPNGKAPPAFTRFMLNVLLVKAREDPPWAAMFSSVLTRVPPLGPLFTRLYGPHTSSITFGDMVRIIDPYFLVAGKNVEFGFDCTIIAHHFDNRGLLLKKVTIGDDVVIGGEATIMAGVVIGDHSIVANRSVVKPNTIIGSYEYWGGVPAVKIKDLKPDDAQS